MPAPPRASARRRGSIVRGSRLDWLDGFWWFRFMIPLLSELDQRLVVLHLHLERRRLDDLDGDSAADVGEMLCANRARAAALARPGRTHRLLALHVTPSPWRRSPATQSAHVVCAP